MALERPNPSGGPSKAKKEKLSVVLVGVDELAEDAARDAAERQLTASKESMRGFRGFFKKMWTHGIAREYYRQKQLARVREAIHESDDIYAAEQDPRIEKTAHEHAMRAIVDRFSSEYKETLHEGETKESVTKEGNEELHTAITDLIKEYAAGSLTDENFAEARTRVLGQVSASREEASGNGMYADNLLEVARQARLAVEHGRAIDDLDLELDIKIGTAKNNIRTRANYNAADKLIERLKKTSLGVVVNEATLASGVAIAYSIGVGMTRQALSSKAATALTFGGSALIAGAFTGFAENKRLKEDRGQHAREMAQGRTYEHGKSPRREEMDQFIYEMREAASLSAGLRERLYQPGLDGTSEARELGEDERSELIAYLADIEARITLAERESIDLIGYSNPMAVEQERLDLDIARAQSKVELRKAFEQNAAAGSKSMDELLDVAINARIHELTKGESGIEERNQLFNKMKTKKVAQAAARGVAVGLVIGGVAQEGIAFASDSQVGFVEHLVRGDEAVTDAGRVVHATPIEWIRGLFEDRLPAGELPSHSVSLDNGIIRLPESMSLVSDGEGYQLTENGKVLIDGLSLTPEGTFDQESLDQLAENGLLATTDINQVEQSTTATVSTQEFVERHPEMTTHISRDLWFDNDTSAPVFDKNELRLWWGGEGNTGIDPDGKYTFTVDQMMENGSFHNGLSVDAQELVEEGKLRMLFSISEDTQAHPIEVPIQPDGTVRIDPDSEVGKLLFKTTDGQAEFLGRFAEVAEVTGTDESGVEHMRILATHEGEGLPDVQDTVTTTVPQPVTTLDVPQDYRFAPPPIIPIFGRKPLEPLVGPRPVMEPSPLVGVPAAPVYYGLNSADDLSSEMERAKVDPDPYFEQEVGGKKIWVDKEGNEVKRDSLREGRRIQTYLDRQEPQYREELETLVAKLEPMHENCRVSISIPARFEESNLENLLDQYSKQTGADGQELDKDLFELVILVNRKEGETPDRSMEIIEDWKAKNPGYHVQAIDITFSPEKANVGMARKYLVDSMLLRSAKRPKSAGPLYIESEDADLFAIDRRTVDTIIRKFDERPHLDVLRGIQDRQPEVLQKNSLLFFERRLWDFMEVFMRRQAYRPEHLKGSSFVWNRVISGGWNTAFTAESYAQIGGYVSDVIGEDMKVGQKISILRGHKNESEEFVLNTQTAAPSGLRSNSSPRRFIDAMARQISPYADFENQSLKEKTLDQLLEGIKEYEHIDSEQKKVYERAINTLGSFIREQLVEPHARDVFTRTLTYIGLTQERDYEIDSKGKVKLTSKGMPRIARLLSYYKTQQRYSKGYARQNNPLDLTS